MDEWAAEELTITGTDFREDPFVSCLEVESIATLHGNRYGKDEKIEVQGEDILKRQNFIHLT